MKYDTLNNMQAKAVVTDAANLNESLLTRGSQLAFDAAFVSKAPELLTSAASRIGNDLAPALNNPALQLGAVRLAQHFIDLAGTVAAKVEASASNDLVLGLQPQRAQVRAAARPAGPTAG